MYEIIIGIPSYNEGPRISFVVEQVDKGLQQHYPDKKAIIVNTDGGSTDNTKDSFLGTETKTEKKVLCKEGVTGKGNVLRMLFELARENQAKAIMIVDADLESITPEWVKLLIQPLMDGYDYCTPMYSRHKYDGTITNNIVYPLVYGLYGMDIRQPIGGDFSFSGRLAEHWLEQEWKPSTGMFGIDNFMTTTAITGNFKICQVGLGAKIHKPSAPSLSRMFIEVVDTLFFNIKKSMDFIRKVSEVKETEILGLELQPPQELEVDKEATKSKAIAEIDSREEIIKKHAPEDFLQRMKQYIEVGDWFHVVYTVLKEYIKNPSIELLEAFRGLYFMRVYSFMEETWTMSTEEAEKKIKEQAELFFRNRHLFLED